MDVGLNYFSKKTVNMLAQNGVVVLGLVSIPGSGPMPWANSMRGYALDDNGTYRVRTFNEVLKLAERKQTSICA